MATKEKVPLISQRSGNYPPSLWDDTHIQSLGDYSKEDHTDQIEQLKEAVRSMIEEEKGVVEQLELIDALQQLGLAYHFDEEIMGVLMNIYKSIEEVFMEMEQDLYAKSLLFRLLRENGFIVSQDVFKPFQDGTGCFKTNLQHDTRGLLSLYQASFFSKEGEKVMDCARDLTITLLKNLITLEGISLDPSITEEINYALELPLNWRMQRLHSRWFIERCAREETINPILIEFAKLDFNKVQRVHQQELSHLSRWWADMGLLGEKLKFSRNRLVENYFWAVGWASEPKSWRIREAWTKFNCFITTIDDIYDIYGSLDELELFTDAVERSSSKICTKILCLNILIQTSFMSLIIRWELSTIDLLPEYMRICFLALFNTTNQISYKILKDKSVDIIPFLKRAWVDLCKAYLMEAKWYDKGYTPTLKEYLDNAWITISGVILLSVPYCVNEDVTVEVLEHFKSYPDIIRWSSTILRLCDDLATSTDELKRGDVQKSIQCYIHEKGVSETEARQHVMDLITVYWKRLNGEHYMATSRFQKVFQSAAFNIPRAAHCIYQHGDGYGTHADSETKDRIISVLIEPLSG